jgi:EPS-associated MarR family transcriptional regulator
MIEQNNFPQKTEKEETFSLLTEIHNSSASTQRELSLKLNVSLGKVNYLLKEVVRRGWVSIKSFSSNPQKLKKVKYALTPRGFSARVDLLDYFFKKKELEYQQLKEQWEKSQKEHRDI